MTLSSFDITDTKVVALTPEVETEGVAFAA